MPERRTGPVPLVAVPQEMPAWFIEHEAREDDRFRHMEVAVARAMSSTTNKQTWWLSAAIAFATILGVFLHYLLGIGG